MWGYVTTGGGFNLLLLPIFAKEAIDDKALSEKHKTAQWFYETKGYQCKIRHLSFSHLEDYYVPLEIKTYFNDNYENIRKEYLQHCKEIEQKNKKPTTFYDVAIFVISVVVAFLLIF